MLVCLFGWLVWFGWFSLVLLCLVSFVCWFGLFVWSPPGALHFPVAGTGNRAVTPRRVAVRVLGVLSVDSARCNGWLEGSKGLDILEGKG